MKDEEPLGIQPVKTRGFCRRDQERRFSGRCLGLKMAMRSESAQRGRGGLDFTVGGDRRAPTKRVEGDLRPHGGCEAAIAEDLHHALHLVAEYVQRHFGVDLLYRLHLEVG